MNKAENFVDEMIKRILAAHPQMIMLILVFALGLALAPYAGAEEADHKPRIYVITDVGGDEDDEQSLVRLLVYAEMFDIEGIAVVRVGGTGSGPGFVRPHRAQSIIAAYGNDLPNLRQLSPNFPDASTLADVVKSDYHADITNKHAQGSHIFETEASRHVIEVLKKDDNRPIWFQAWGGLRPLAAALYHLDQRGESTDTIKNKIRVHTIEMQDYGTRWLIATYPDLFWVEDWSFRGLWMDGDQSLIDLTWVESNIRGHGSLGAIYPDQFGHKNHRGVKEGDTPTFLRLIDNGLNVPERPELGGWGGRFEYVGHVSAIHTNRYHASGEIGSDPFNTIYNPDRQLLGLFQGRKWSGVKNIVKYRRQFQNDFAARMKWVRDGVGNRPPKVVVNGCSSTAIMEIEVGINEDITLDASESTDPDGDTLSFNWYQNVPERRPHYKDTPVYMTHHIWTNPPTLRPRVNHSVRSPTAIVRIPSDASGRVLMIICGVTDNGSPNLTRYRRIMLNVR